MNIFAIVFIPWNHGTWQYRVFPVLLDVWYRVSEQNKWQLNQKIPHLTRPQRHTIYVEATDPVDALGTAIKVNKLNDPT